MSDDREERASEALGPPQLRQLTTRIEGLLEEHHRLRSERDEARRRYSEQGSELEALKKQFGELARGREAARRRIDALIGDLGRAEERAE